MADQDRRGDDTRDHEHAWAELTWRMLVGFIFKYGFVPGLIVGWVTFGIGLWTNWYQTLLTILGNGLISFAVQYWYLLVGFTGLALGFLYVNRRWDKRSKQ